MLVMLCEGEVRGWTTSTRAVRAHTYQVNHPCSEGLDSGGAIRRYARIEPTAVGEELP
jgi:hypothetical protein